MRLSKIHPNTFLHGEKKPSPRRNFLSGGVVGVVGPDNAINSVEEITCSKEALIGIALFQQEQDDVVKVDVNVFQQTVTGHRGLAHSQHLRWRHKAFMILCWRRRCQGFKWLQVRETRLVFINKIRYRLHHNTEVGSTFDITHWKTKVKSDQRLCVSLQRWDNKGQLGHILQTNPNAHVSITEVRFRHENGTSVRVCM